MVANNASRGRPEPQRGQTGMPRSQQDDQPSSPKTDKLERLASIISICTGSGDAKLQPREGRGHWFCHPWRTVRAPAKTLSGAEMNLQPDLDPQIEPTTTPERSGCKRCGRPIKGRRTNGFCGDACRMRVNRSADSARHRALLNELKRLVKALALEFRMSGKA